MPEATETAHAKATFEQAYDSAKAELDKPAEVSKPEGETKSEETTKQPEQTTGETPAKEAPETEELLSTDEVANLTPEQQATYKKMQKAYTQKTQKLAAERKAHAVELERLKSWEPIIESFETSPEETIKRAAKQYGIKLVDEAGAKPVQQSAVDTAVTAMRDRLRQLHGPEHEAYADELANTFQAALEAVAKEVVSREVQPLKAQQEAALQQAAMESTENDLSAMDKRHPGWRDHEQKMLDISRKWQPAEGANITAAEYLDMLYGLATRDQTRAADTQEVIERINKSARASEPETAVNAQIVTPARPKRPTMEEAFDAAKRGVAW